ncbi:hypothetical protein CBR_g268 [Chara braunii]|uniref:Uncharacterized protein n=1 Tax=Chara braunii TaxID=69332 RepID=A0A388JM24_CHABU|nr:hypothetical protein CBR_g268 [Chara braunii]|eukprot:GBG58869.1 hypothetical protein CBR_g268 [Chara braunii]
MAAVGRQALVLGALKERVTLLEARIGEGDPADLPRVASMEGGGEDGYENEAGNGIGGEKNVRLTTKGDGQVKAKGEEDVPPAPSRQSETIGEKWRRLSRSFYSRETTPAREFRQLSSTLAAQSPQSPSASTPSPPPPPAASAPVQPTSPRFTRTVSAHAARPWASRNSPLATDRSERSMVRSHSSQMMMPSSTSARREVVLASDEWLSTTKKTYRAVLELYNRVRKRTPTVVASDLEGRLQRLDALHQKQLLAVAMLDERCNVLLNSYNTAIRSIACKLLQWDTTLSAWEESIQKMAPPKKDESG